MAEIKYEIVERIAVLGERPRGWERQLNLISWNEGEPKYDIRDWSPHGQRHLPEPRRAGHPEGHPRGYGAVR